RLVDAERAQHWNGRGHFFAAAAEAMRRILVDHARHKQSRKRGGDRARLDLDQFAVATSERLDDVLDIDAALAGLAGADPQAADRRAYLDAACARRPELRRQVEDLLRLHEGAGSFLEKPAAELSTTRPFQDTAEQASPPEAAGAVIGPYKLIEQLGEGGMGTVW